MGALLFLIEVSGFHTCSPLSGFLWNGTGEGFKQFIYLLLFIETTFACTNCNENVGLQPPRLKYYSRDINTENFQCFLDQCDRCGRQLVEIAKGTNAGRIVHTVRSGHVCGIHSS